MEASGSSTGSPAGCEQTESLGGGGSRAEGFEQPQEKTPFLEWRGE